MISLYVKRTFSLVDFKNLILSLSFNTQLWCVWVGISLSYVEVRWVPWMCEFMFLVKFGMVSTNISLNIFMPSFCFPILGLSLHIHWYSQWFQSLRVSLYLFFFLLLRFNNLYQFTFKFASSDLSWPCVQPSWKPRIYIYSSIWSPSVAVLFFASPC